MSQGTPELIFDGRQDLAECPVWRDGHLWWVNITEGELHRLDPVTSHHEQRKTGGLVGFAAPCADGRWLLARDREVICLDWESGAATSVCAVEPEIPHNRFNDGRPDPQGRLWAGTMDQRARQTTGSLYIIQAGCRPRRVLENLTISNGMAWSPDGRVFYFTDSATHRVDIFDFNATDGAITNRRALAAFTDTEFPDGMTMDSEGNLWVALWGAGAVVCLDGRTGLELLRLGLPVSQPSSCTFGGAKFDELYITTARTGLIGSALEREPQAGGIFRIKPGVCGQPSPESKPAT